MTNPIEQDICTSIVAAIAELTQDELTSVEIHNPNPDFGGPNFAINYHIWPDLEEVIIRYDGESLLECLQKAVANHCGPTCYWQSSKGYSVCGVTRSLAACGLQYKTTLPPGQPDICPRCNRPITTERDEDDNNI